MNKEALKTDLKEVLQDMRHEVDQDQSIDRFAEELANVIDNYIRTATIYATTVQISSAFLSNSAGPVTAGYKLNCTIE